MNIAHCGLFLIFCYHILMWLLPSVFVIVDPKLLILRTQASKMQAIIRSVTRHDVSVAPAYTQHCMHFAAMCVVHISDRLSDVHTKHEVHTTKGRTCSMFVLCVVLCVHIVIIVC
jgi:hypothetical protein